MGLLAAIVSLRRVVLKCIGMCAMHDNHGDIWNSTFKRTEKEKKNLSVLLTPCQQSVNQRQQSVHGITIETNTKWIRVQV